MLRKILYILLLTAINLMAIQTGDTLESKIVKELKMKPDQIYIIDFFASWCKGCEKELPLISKVHSSKLVEVIGINVDIDKKAGEDFVTKLQLPFTVIYDDGNKLISTFDPIGMPALFFVENGKVLKCVIGTVDEIDKKIEDYVGSLK